MNNQDQDRENADRNLETEVIDENLAQLADEAIADDALGVGATATATPAQVDLDDASKQTLITDLSAICEVENNVAEGMLVQHKWNIQEAIDVFLNESRDNDAMLVDEVNEGNPGYPRQETGRNSITGPASNIPSVVVDLTQDPTSPEIQKEYNVEKEKFVTVTLPLSPSSRRSSDEFSTWAPEKLSIVSWNLDGLDDKNLEKRTTAVLEQILREEYAIIFLQELIPQTFDYFARNLNTQYVPIPGTEDPSVQYLTGTFLRRNHVIYEDHLVLPFPKTGMGRTLLIAKAFIGRAKLYLLNTHLESTAEFTAERQEQLKFCFRKFEEISPEYNVIFGGDLNLRDKEVSNVPPNTVDLWIKCGSRETCRYTWDLTRNTNKQMPSKFQPRLRFDRLYFRSSVPETLTPEFFGVTGIEKVAGTQSFPSDHWAIQSFFAVSKEARKPLPKKRKAENLPTDEVEYIPA